MGRQIDPLLMATLALSGASCGSDGGEAVEPERPQIGVGVGAAGVEHG